jgi:hypothetical protein
MCLGHFLKYRYQAGEDYYIVQGPLGSLMWQTYYPGLFWPEWAWEVAVKLALAVMALAVGSQVRGRAARAAWYTLLILLPITPDALYLLAVLLPGILFLRAEGRVAVAWLAVAAALAAALSLMKFTYFLVSLALFLTLSLSLLRKRGWGRALLPLPAFLLTLLAAWAALGQSPWNLPRFVRGSWEVAAGYEEAMALEGSTLEVYLALAILVTLGAAWGTLLSRRFFRTRGQVAQAVLLATGLLLAWKHGFVRHDAHSLTFFSYTLFTPFLLPPPLERRRWAAARRVALLGCVLLSVIGLLVVEGRPAELLPQLHDRLAHNAEFLLRPSRFRDRLEEEWSALEGRSDLPLTRALVGEAPVDLFSHSQQVLLLNHMNYHPRPVFQSYSAYTPSLQAANAEFFKIFTPPLICGY